MPIKLYDRGGHRCLMFCDLGQGGDDALQSNQFLVVDQEAGALIDPGGNLVYGDLFVALSREFPPARLGALLASHADPDVITSLDRWMTATSATVYISTLWQNFLPHLCKPGKTQGRIVGIPDRGMRIPLGGTELVALPGHFMHSEGNFQFFDPVSGILFSGDLGASLVSAAQAEVTLRSLSPMPPGMESFHRRCMGSNRILRLWADMVAMLPLRMVVPQHGSPMAGKAVHEFIDWVRGLECGIDRMGPADFAIPV